MGGAILRIHRMVDDASLSFHLSTPVVFFVFNRPELTRSVFARIRAARPPLLLVVADGPRDNQLGESNLTQQVRRLILEGIDWPCELRTDFSGTNLGCGPRIYSGLQWVFNQVDEAIILEDDCLPEPTFFQFCEEMLVRYRNEPRVFMVTGTNFGGAHPDRSDRCLFSRHCSIWGWATWRRALQDYSLDLSWWRSEVHPADLRTECADWREHRFICDLLDSQKSGAVNTWDIQWFAHVFRQGGLSVVPGTNLITNLGTTGTHTQGTMTGHHMPTSAARFPTIPPQGLENDLAYGKVFVERHRPPGGWYLGYFAARLARSFAGPMLRRIWRFSRRHAPRRMRTLLAGKPKD